MGWARILLLEEESTGASSMLYWRRYNTLQHENT